MSPASEHALSAASGPRHQANSGVASPATITALHSLVFAEDAETARAFIRDVLRLPCVDTGGGWLIFKTGPSELGVHPDRWDGPPPRSSVQHFDLSLVCDDLAATMAELSGRGAQSVSEVVEQEWGTTVELAIPGAGTIMLYEPKYEPPAFLP